MDRTSLKKLKVMKNSDEIITLVKLVMVSGILAGVSAIVLIEAFGLSSDKTIFVGDPTFYTASIIFCTAALCFSLAVIRRSFKQLKKLL